MNINSDQLHRLGCRRSSPSVPIFSPTNRLSYQVSVIVSPSSASSSSSSVFVSSPHSQAVLRGHLLPALTQHQNHTLLTLTSSGWVECPSLCLPAVPLQLLHSSKPTTAPLQLLYFYTGLMFFFMCSYRYFPPSHFPSSLSRVTVKVREQAQSEHFTNGILNHISRLPAAPISSCLANTCINLFFTPTISTSLSFRSFASFCHVFP